MRAALFLASVALAVAAVSGESLELNPFTLSDGTIVDPHTQPDEARAARDDTTAGGIYTTLSHGGPMAGNGPMAGHRHFRG